MIVEVGDGAGPVQATALFHDAAIDAPTTPRVTLADPAARACWARSSPRRRPPAAKGGAALADALVALGLAARDAAGTVTVVTDAVDAMQADPAAFLGRRARAALAAGADLFGVTGAPEGPWTASDPDLPLAVELAPDHLTVSLAALEAAGVVLSGELTWAAPAATPRISLTATGVGASLRWDTAAGSLVLVPGPSADPVTLVPSPGGEALAARLGPLLVEQLVAATAGAALLDRPGPGWELGPLAELLIHPDRALLAPGTAGGAPSSTATASAPCSGCWATWPAWRPAATATGPACRCRAASSCGPAASRADCRCAPSPRSPSPVPATAPRRARRRARPDCARPHDRPRRRLRLTLDVPLGGTWGGLGVTLGLDGGTVSLAVIPRAGTGRRSHRSSSCPASAASARWRPAPPRSCRRCWTR